MFCLEFPFKILTEIKIVNLRDFLKKKNTCIPSSCARHTIGWSSAEGRMTHKKRPDQFQSIFLSPFTQINYLLVTRSKFLHNICLIEQLRCTIRPLYCRWGKVERPTIQLKLDRKLICDVLLALGYQNKAIWYKVLNFVSKLFKQVDRKI